jgi:protein glucosyltransferase
MAAGAAIPFEKKLPLAAFTGNTQAEPRQRLALVAKSNPDVLFVNQVYKKSDTGGKSCVDLGLADKGGLQEDKCALSFEEMCGYRYLVNVGSNGYAN